GAAEGVVDDADAVLVAVPDDPVVGLEHGPGLDRQALAGAEADQRGTGGRALVGAVGGDAPAGDVTGDVGAVPGAGVGVGQPLDGGQRPVGPERAHLEVGLHGRGEVGVEAVDATVDDGHRDALPVN